MNKLGIVFLVTLLLLSLSTLPICNVREVYINGELNNHHGISQMLRERNFFWTSAKYMSEMIEADKMYDTAAVNKVFFMSVEVDLVERLPFIAIESGGYYVVIDAYGVVLALSETPDAPYVIEGFNVTSAVLGEPLVADEMSLIERAVQIVYMFQSHTEYQPKVSLVDGQIIQEMNEQISINFGLSEEVELQFNQALVIYEDLISKGSTSGIINVSDPDQPYVEPVKR